MYCSIIKKRSGDHHKDAIIKRILDAGLEVRKEIVASFDLEIDALAYEWFLINIVYGLRNLTNMTEGSMEHALKGSPRLLGVPDEMPSDDVAHYLKRITKYRRGIKREVLFKKAELDRLLEIRPDERDEE